MNGSNSTEGRVEICYNNVYGTVCDDQWGLLDAVVACRKLGFSAMSMLLACTCMCLLCMSGCDCERASACYLVCAILLNIYMCCADKILYTYMVIHDNFYNAGPEAFGQAYFGQGQGEIYLENVQCNGSENSLEDCPASELGVHDCNHSEDAGVRCQGMGILIREIVYFATTTKQCV